MQQWQHPAQDRIGRVGRGRVLQQRRQHPVQARARGVGEIAHAGRAGEIAETGVQFGGVLEAGGVQRRGIVVLGQRAPVGGELVATGRAAAARGQQCAELLRHQRALRRQRGIQRRPVRIPQPGRQAGAGQRVLGQRVGLRIAQHLQAILQAAQEAIGGGQRRCRRRFHVPGLRQRPQRRQQVATAQRRLAAAADKLQRLRQELDLADAARPALDVAGHVLARHFGGDHRLHRAQPVQRAIVEVAAVHERPQRLEKAFAGGDIAGHAARLLPGIALPVAALALEIQLHRRERQRHAPGVAERAQAQVHPMAEAVRGHLVQQLRQLLAQPREIVLRVQAARAVGFAFVLVGVDQVDVGAEIQLAPAQLAEAEHHQPLDCAGGIAHHPESPREVRLQRVQRQPQAGFRQRAAACEDLVDVSALDHVAPDQPGRFRLPVATQQPCPVGLALRLQQRRRHWRPGIGLQLRQQLRLAGEHIDGEVAGQRQSRQRRFVGNRAAGRAQALQGARGQGLQLGGIHVVHAPIVASPTRRYRADP